MQSNKVPINDLSEYENGINAENEERLRAKGLKPFFSLNEGQNDFEIGKPTHELQEEQGVRVVFPIRVGGKEYEWTVSKKNPIVLDLFSKVKKLNENEYVPITVFREGVGKKTQYSLSEA